MKSNYGEMLRKNESLNPLNHRMIYFYYTGNFQATSGAEPLELRACGFSLIDCLHRTAGAWIASQGVPLPLPRRRPQYTPRALRRAVTTRVCASSC